jgi:perosamine synthetase
MQINRLHGISKNAWDRYTTKGSWYYEVVDNGNKYNTTDINSAIGIVQLSKQDILMKKRNFIADKYNNAFSNNKNIILPYIKNDRTTSWHLYVIKIKNRDDIIEQLKDLGIGCSVHFIPIHKHPYYKTKYNLINEDYPIANEVFETSLSLPIYPDMTNDEVAYIIENINKITNKAR